MAEQDNSNSKPVSNEDKVSQMRGSSLALHDLDAIQKQTANILQSFRFARPADSTTHEEFTFSMEQQIQSIVSSWGVVRTLLHWPNNVPSALGDDIKRTDQEIAKRVKELLAE
jgi:hypothetical protein